MSRLLNEALCYAGRGLPVLPLHTPQGWGCSCEQEDCSIGKHPRTRHGLDDASTDRDHIRAWWAKSEDANIGILTGSASGLVVLVVDNRDGVDGSDNLAELGGHLRRVTRTLTAITGNGKHLYFKHPRGW